MELKSTCLLTIITIKTVSATKNLSIFEALPFVAYFDVVQCCLLLILTIVILILTAIHFRQSTPSKLTLSRPSTFEYYVLIGEKSNGTSISNSNIGTGASTERTNGTTNQSTGRESEIGTGTGTETELTKNSGGVSYISM
ncbi:hypothetical protein GCK72_005254 [Caenorhabditis remanei]|uniref:Uncharacterized protein n=1 Tax=Caenorhabditis remanei TaxID=31234 RepID=A0A6A5HGS1_CAERE|nr:hypothetical protein GCK72_005254 [Caenorhabditis remanei]KAF1765302.1 hypothetical protein GCK72_005254 [Caenorhabditis remanei]